MQTIHPVEPSDHRSIALLNLGLYVIETRDRDQDKNLGPWRCSSAFAHAKEVEDYYNKFESIGYWRLFHPSGTLIPPWKRAIAEPSQWWTHRVIDCVTGEIMSRHRSYRRAEVTSRKWFFVTGHTQRIEERRLT